MANETIEAKGRLYNLGNDYPSDVGFRDADLDGTTWIPGSASYLDGIYTSAAEGYITGAWNKYFNTVLPQSTWSAVEDKEFGLGYASAEVNEEAAYSAKVAAYAE